MICVGEDVKMERAEAFHTLRLDPSADGKMVEHAYWTLVRQVQGMGDTNGHPAHDIERLNEAYAALAPDARRYVPARSVSAQGGEFVDHVAEWLATEALRTRVRWSARNPEIAVIGGVMLVLMVLALSAGASILATFVAVALGFAAIWAPWRRVRLGEDD
jgi:hypothetical protein